MTRNEFIEEAYRKADNAGRIDDEMVIRFYLDMFESMGMLPPCKDKTLIDKVARNYEKTTYRQLCKWDLEEEDEA